MGNGHLFLLNSNICFISEHFTKKRLMNTRNVKRRRKKVSYYSWNISELICEGVRGDTGNGENPWKEYEDETGK